MLDVSELFGERTRRLEGSTGAMAVALISGTSETHRESHRVAARLATAATYPEQREEIRAPP